MGAVACATVPYTKRSQLILVSASEEARLGAQAYGEVLQRDAIEHRPAMVQPVEEVGRRLAAVANRPDFDWRFTVVDDPKEVNAFCLPGGKVVVYSGIFPVLQDTNGLAVVLGHEIAHAIARHGAERASQRGAADALGAAIGVAGGGSADVLLAAYGLGTQLGVLLPYSRVHESEADHIGLLLMAQAGYDPRGALAFWDRMQASGGGGRPEFLSTHPSHGSREAQLRAWMPEALAYFARASPAPLERLP